MLSKRQQREVEGAAAVVANLFREAVQETLDEPGPEPARQAIAAVLEADEPYPVDVHPASTIATITLLAWTGGLREELADRPDRIEVLLAWIEEHLGRRYRARARYTAPALLSEADAEETAQYAQGLGPDYLASILWLVAAAVACYGEGDTGWLRRVVEAPADGS